MTTEATVAVEVAAEAAMRESGTPEEMVDAVIVRAARASGAGAVIIKIDSSRIQKLSEGFWPRCFILVSKVARTPSQLDFTTGGAAGLGYVFKGF